MREKYLTHVNRVINNRFNNDMKEIMNNPDSSYVDKLIREHLQRRWRGEWREENVDAFKSNLRIGGVFAENNAILLVKEKTKRNDYEKESFNFILMNSPPLIMSETKNLGNREIYLYKGDFLNKEEVNNLIDRPKSLDFRFCLDTVSGKRISIYVTHKYTNQGGGSQDNQFNDIKSTLDNVSDLCDNIYVVAICDGNYFTKMNKDGNTKFNELKNTYEESSNNIFIHNTDTFISFLHDIYKENY